MTELMIISGLVLIICITSTKVLYKFGVPMLLIFIVLGDAVWVRWISWNLF